MTQFTLAYYPTENKLFANLPKEDFQKLLPYLEPVILEAGKILFEPGEQPAFIYFPTTALVSLLYTSEEGISTGIGLIGNEGLVGLSLFLGGTNTTSQAVVQRTGGAIRLNARVLKQELDRGGLLTFILLRYTQDFITQITQTAVCNRFHLIKHRVCRWILLSHDRVKGDHLELTQQVLANLAGGHREGVALVVEQLQATGVIRYVRGRMTILDRRALEDNVCECYPVVRAELECLIDNGSCGSELLSLA